MFLFLYFCDRVSLSVFEALDSAQQVYVRLITFYTRLVSLQTVSSYF